MFGVTVVFVLCSRAFNVILACFVAVVVGLMRQFSNELAIIGTPTRSPTERGARRKFDPLLMRAAYGFCESLNSAIKVGWKRLRSAKKSRQEKVQKRWQAARERNETNAQPNTKC